MLVMVVANIIVVLTIIIYTTTPTIAIVDTSDYLHLNY
jgi:hypothetical protein